jgi:hypothetical protein
MSVDDTREDQSARKICSSRRWRNECCGTRVAAYVDKLAVLDGDRLGPWLSVVDCEESTARQHPVSSDDLLGLRSAALDAGNHP